MSHIYGHWENEGPTSVGAHTAKKKFCGISMEGKSGEKFLVLGINNHGLRGKRDGEVGFHLDLFRSEAVDQFYGVAFDIVHWEDHVDAEAYFNSMMGKSGKLEEYHDFEFEAFNSLPDNLTKLDEVVIARLTPLPDGQARIREYLNRRSEKMNQVKVIIQQTRRYKNSTSFQLIKGKAPHEIVDLLLETDMVIKYHV
jgi:hypothetical protein